MADAWGVAIEDVEMAAVLGVAARAYAKDIAAKYEQHAKHERSR